MEKKTAHFDLVKQQNKRVIRNLLRDEAGMSISKIGEKTKLSYPTCSSLLKELLSDGQVMLEKEMESCGGRPGVVYSLNGNYKYTALILLKEGELVANVYNYRGDYQQTFQWMVTQNTCVNEIVDMVKEIKEDYPLLDNIAMGIPGVVNQNEICFLPIYKKLQNSALALEIQRQCDLAVVLQNDLNAMAYSKADEGKSFAMVASINHCIGVGIVLEGALHTGVNGWAGELEEICTHLEDEKQTLYECIYILMLVLDLPEFWIAGDSCSIELLREIEKMLQKKMDKNRVPRLYLVDDLEASYVEGLKRSVIDRWKEELS